MLDVCEIQLICINFDWILLHKDGVLSIQGVFHLSEVLVPFHV